MDVTNAKSTQAGRGTSSTTLAGKYSVAITQTSRLIRKAEIYSLVTDLVSAFDLCLVKSETTDPNCLAKTAIAEALYHLDYREAALFPQGKATALNLTVHC